VKGTGRELGAEGLQRLAAPALEVRGAEGVEVVVQRAADAVTRFANSQIHQNVETETIEVRVRVVLPGGRSGVTAVTTDDPAQVAEAAAQARTIAGHAPEDPAFPGLAPAAPAAAADVDRATVEASPAERAAAVAALLAQVPAGFEAAGALETGAAELGVFTTAGQAVSALVSRAALTTVVSGPSSSGYGEEGGPALSGIDPGAMGRRAAEKARLGADPVDVEPGDWAVVLEPAATGALVQFLSYLGFGARAYLEGRAFTSGRLGQAAADPKITLLDDVTAPGAVGFPFDAEGTPKRRVALIQDGVLAGVVHDRATAAEAGTDSTGHGLPAPNTWGPLATNPLLEAGDGGSIADLVAGVERGLLVTRFHYTNVVHALETVLTGMTRDGTFLIEDGRLVRGVRNLRFTQSALGALAKVDAVGTETGYASELFFGGARCPALRLPAFAFTSTTTFG
jgi:predicted Zn-dependent protease